MPYSLIELDDRVYPIVCFAGDGIFVLFCIIETEVYNMMETQEKNNALLKVHDSGDLDDMIFDSEDYYISDR